MIGFVVGKVDFAEVESFVDGTDQADLLGEFVQERDAAEAEAAEAVAKIKANETAAKDGFAGIGELGLSRRRKIGHTL